MKRAFTLLELVVVIVVLGIIAMMSFNAIMNIYSNYFQTRTVNELETQTEIALEQISKRLEHRIKPSVIARKTDGAFLALNDSGVNLNAEYEILEFIPYAYEIFNDVPSGNKAGRYSGYVDLAKSSPATGLISPGSNFSTEVVETIKDLTCREDTNATCVDFAKKDGGVVAIFSDVYYNVQSSFGYSNGTVPVSLDIAKVGVKGGQSGLNGDTLEISGFGGKQISNYAFSVDIAGGEFQNLVKKSHFAVNASGKSLEKLENLTEENIKKDTAMGLLVLEKAMCLVEK